MCSKEFTPLHELMWVGHALLTPVFMFQTDYKRAQLKGIRNHFILKLINVLAKFRVGKVQKTVMGYFLG